MPSNVVKDEHLWDKAKGIVKKQYPKMADGSDRFYRLVMGIYKQMHGAKSMYASYPILETALQKAKVAHQNVGTGELSETTRKQIGRVGEKKREDMPAHIFLLPDERKYPVKVKQDGKWIYSLKLLLAAARRARMQKREGLASRADRIRERLQKTEKSMMAADYPQVAKARVKAHQRRMKSGKIALVREYETSRQAAGKRGAYDEKRTRLEVDGKQTYQIAVSFTGKDSKGHYSKQVPEMTAEFMRKLKKKGWTPENPNYPERSFESFLRSEISGLYKKARFPANKKIILTIRQGEPYPFSKHLALV